MADDSCRYCGAPRLAPVLDMNIEERNKPGNKYRRLCRSCDRWGHMTSAEAWESSEDRLVLPAGQPRDAEHVIPSSVLEDDPDPDPDPDPVEEQPENEFDCPACGSHLTGYPEECPACEAPFEWT